MTLEEAKAIVAEEDARLSKISEARSLIVTTERRAKCKAGEHNFWGRDRSYCDWCGIPWTSYLKKIGAKK